MWELIYDCTGFVAYYAKQAQIDKNYLIRAIIRDYLQGCNILYSLYVNSSIWLITLGSYSVTPISFKIAIITWASLGVILAGAAIFFETGHTSFSKRDDPSPRDNSRFAMANFSEVRMSVSIYSKSTVEAIILYSNWVIVMYWLLNTDVSVAVIFIVHWDHGIKDQHSQLDVYTYWSFVEKTYVKQNIKQQMHVDFSFCLIFNEAT